MKALTLLSLAFLLASPVHADEPATDATLSATAGLAQRFGAGRDGRLALGQGLAYDLDGWIVGLRALEVVGAGARDVRVGAELGYRFRFPSVRLSLGPTLTAGYANLTSTEPRVTGVLHGFQAEVAVEIRLRLAGGLHLLARPAVGGVAYRGQVRDLWRSGTAGLAWDF